jgi:hypothetical protein
MTGFDASGRRTRVRVGLVITAAALLAALVAPARAVPPPGDTPRPVATALVPLSGTVFHTGTLEYVDVSATLRLITASVFRPARSVVVVAVAVQNATAYGQSTGRAYRFLGGGAAQRVVSQPAPVHVVMTFTPRLIPPNPIRPSDPIHPSDPFHPTDPFRTWLDFYVGTGGISAALATFHPSDPI